MSLSIPEPDPHSLLPPLLAVLPTSFASARPPPDLLPLLSPVLRQRVEIHTSTSTSGHDSWLRLLCWDESKADKLKDLVEDTTFEPHPSSGEVEVGEVEALVYKRFDEETFRAQVVLSDWPFVVTYLWCIGGDQGDGWRVAELLPREANIRDRTWLGSVNAAEEAFTAPAAKSARLEVTGNTRKDSVARPQDDDDDYWAQYDQTPGETPAGHTPARKASYNPGGGGMSSEAEYYAQYADVQPAMDNHDPDEEMQPQELSSLHSTTQQMLTAQAMQQQKEKNASPYHERLAPPEDADMVHVNQPVPSSPSSRAGSDTVAKLEQRAERYTASDIAIRQHISTSMKSMYRLAKSSGINRSDFEGMIQRELEILSILDEDE